MQALFYLIAIVLLVVATFWSSTPPRPSLVTLAGAFALTAFAWPTLTAVFQ